MGTWDLHGESGPFTLQPRITCDYSNLGLGRRVQSLCSPSNMESIKAVFFKPDPQAQVRKCNQLIRQNTRKQHNRLVTSKAQLNSVSMQVTEAFAVRKIEGSIRSSVGIMKDVNSLVKLPELMGTMRELSQELVKAGIIEEMVGDSLPDELEEADEEAETEVDKVLGEILTDKMSKVG